MGDSRWSDRLLGSALLVHSAPLPDSRASWRWRSFPQCLSSLVPIVFEKKGDTLTVLNTTTHYVSWVLSTN
jgi:hypothetical protein